MSKKLYKCPICGAIKEYDTEGKSYYKCKACQRTVRAIETEEMKPAAKAPTLADIEEKKEPAKIDADVNKDGKVDEKDLEAVAEEVKKKSRKKKRRGKKED